MKVSWILGILLLAQQMIPNDEIIVQQDKNTIAIIKNSDYILPIPGGPFLNISSYQQFLNQLEKQIYIEPINASIDDHGTIQPEQKGFILDRERFTAMLYDSFFQSGPKIIDVPTHTLFPKVDTELLSTIREQRIGHYVTYYNAGNKTRSHNIHLAAEAINNQVIFPGETFSFNRTVGKRTKDKGYLLAPVIVKGELSEGIGGGICQVSSTLFNAVDNAGLKIIQRYSHSKRVPYVPDGRDATVSWYGPDFRFQNKFNQPILIKAKTYEGILVIMVFSSDLINYKPRKIPSASHTLPEEIKVDLEINDSYME